MQRLILLTALIGGLAGCSSDSGTSTSGKGGTGGTKATTAGTPAATAGTPAATAGTPAATAGTPAATAGTPAAAAGTPASTAGATAAAGAAAVDCAGDYTAKVAPIMTAQCQTCHSGMAPDMGTIDKLKAEATVAAGDITSGSMPKGGTLTASDKATLLAWLAACK